MILYKSNNYSFHLLFLNSQANLNNSKRFRVKDKDRGEEYSEAEDDFDDDKHYYSLANLTEEDDI